MNRDSKRPLSKIEDASLRRIQAGARGGIDNDSPFNLPKFKAGGDNDSPYNMPKLKLLDGGTHTAPVSGSGHKF